MKCRDDSIAISSCLDMIASCKHKRIEHYSIFSMTGKCVMNSLREQLTMYFQQTGVYLLVLNYDNGSVESMKLFKEKEHFYTQRII